MICFIKAILFHKVEHFVDLGMLEMDGLFRSFSLKN